MSIYGQEYASISCLHLEINPPSSPSSLSWVSITYCSWGFEFLQIFMCLCKKNLKIQKQEKISFKKTLLNQNKAYIISITYNNITNTIQSKLTMKIYNKNPIVLTIIILIKDNYKNPNHKYPH